MRSFKRRPAFSLVELLVVIAIIALLISLIAPALRNARQSARVIVCTSNMRQLITSQYSYGTDNRDLIGSFNWVPGKDRPSSDPSLNPSASSTWLLAQGMQACDIVRRRTGKTTIPLVQNRFFNRNFWHLPLVDGGYFGGTYPIIKAVGCPDDIWVQRWQANPDDYKELVGSSPEPTANPSGAYEWYRPYWSTFQLVPVAFAPDKHPPTGARKTISQITSRHHLFTGGSTNSTQLPLGTRQFSEVAFPSQKVFIFDVFDRHGNKRPIWHAYQKARQPLAMYDHSVLMRRTRDANVGWNPNSPTSSAPTTYSYTPSTGFPGYDFPRLNGEITGSDPVTGYFRWTRKGLKGVDFAARD